jgi:hypothetical protein
MTASKVSEMLAATSPATTDLLYLVNSGNPRKITLGSLADFLTSAKTFVTSVNTLTGVNGAVTLTKSDIGLGNVPNVNPVTTLNSLSGAALIAAGDGLSVTIVGQTITIAVSDLTLDWSALTGDWTSQTALATALANVGVQIAPRTIDSSSADLLLTITDCTRQWVDVDFTVPTQLILPTMSAPLGSMIELRQASADGVVTVTAQDGGTVINQPANTFYATAGLGTRIQLVSLGSNAWEFR